MEPGVLGGGLGRPSLFEVGFPGKGCGGVLEEGRKEGGGKGLKWREVRSGWKGRCRQRGEVGKRARPWGFAGF